MPRYIIITFAWAAVIISLMATMIGFIFGAKGLIAYLIFAGLCLTPPGRLAYRILKKR